MASRTMGCKPNAMLWRVHFPLVKRGALIAALLVFIESMKELNAALLLRPFNFETLATYNAGRKVKRALRLRAEKTHARFAQFLTIKPWTLG